MNEKPVLMPVIKGIDPNVLAADICSVQPMPSDAIANLYKEAKSRERVESRRLRACQSSWFDVDQEG